MSLSSINKVAKKLKVDHPLAKYNAKGDLYCLLCNSLIKNANSWKVHLSTKSHKDQFLLFKAGKSMKNAPLKRPATKADNAPPRSLKKMKTNSSFCEENDGVNTKNKVVHDPMNHGILKQTSKVVPKLPEGFVPKSRQTHNDVDNKNINYRKISEETKSSLPAGFFDDEISSKMIAYSSEDINSIPPEKHENSPNFSKSELPEGFFDDAREDAKARKIEFKDPQELEWEKFQDEMEKEDIRYNTILEEDDQKLREERDIGINIEQKLWNYRVESIASSAETGEICIADKEAFEVKLKVSEKGEKVESKIKEEITYDKQVDIKMEDSSSDECDDFMDWRTKKAI